MPTPRHRPLIALLAFVLASTPAIAVDVVTTLPAYASIARQLVGDLGEVKSISRGDEDAHFVKPKPSFALMLRRADLFVSTGLDLELWAPVLVDKSGNRDIRQGGRGYVSASDGVPLLDVPEVADRSAGDVHLYGNPHIFTSPLNAKRIARNIAEGLARVDPGNRSAYERNLAAFERRIEVALYGERLLEVMGSDTLDRLARAGALVSFLESQTYEGRPSLELLGGWLGEGLAFRGREIVTYHKNWIYFTDLFGLEVAGYVEPKPGIPPSARHVHELIQTIERQRIRVLLAANYFSRRQIDSIADRTGCTAVVVPLGPGGEDASGYFELVDFWVDSLVTAFRTEERR
ncbi:MAG: metal ABC transporter substrate-binding protein [Thermoanaerobaculia bacterium]|nr:metal ABC transporter substrate-binding protein [Thermoanaerobaculia bacterium]